MAHKPSKAKAAESDSPEDEPDEVEEVLRRVRRPVSVPAKASCLTFVFLILAVVVTLIVVLVTGQSMNFGLFWYLAVGALVVVIPIVVYRAVTLWMFDESGRYPDIAYAWNSGISELAVHGMSLDSAPLFLIIGTGSERMRRSFMAASGGEFYMNGVCDSGSPLYWYANNEGIFVYLNDVCWANAAISLYEVSTEGRRRGLPGDVPQEGVGPKKVMRALGTLVPNLRGPSGPPPRRTDTPMHHEDPALPTDQGADVQVELPDMAGGGYMGTITPGQIMANAPAGQPRAKPATVASGRGAAAASSRVINRLTSQQSSQQLQRLEHFCSVLRRRRHPVCPVNGILTLLPFEMLKAGDQEVAELERAISADISTIYNELQLRCPVTAVVVGMDQERGFRELIRRIGREDVAKQRFGQRFDLRTPATVDELRKFTSHVCGTFEDWVYTLFRQEEALSHPGNTALYALLCKVRRTLKSRLGDVLGKGFGYDQKGNKIPVLFSGCYFAATGPKSDRQAFVSGLLSKLYDEQEDIEWTDAALREDRRRGWFIRVGWAISAVTIVAIAGWQVGRRFLP
jgi:ImcF (intracellular multiplication and macrophage-killing)-related protein